MLTQTRPDEAAAGAAPGTLLGSDGGGIRVACADGALRVTRLKPEGRWLFIEDWKEEPYRIDRYLAALQFAGWFEKIAGVIVGDFHTKEGDTQGAVVELLKLYSPAGRTLRPSSSGPTILSAGRCSSSVQA